MPFDDTIELLTGVPVLVVVPALVELAKRAGLPPRFAGLAAIALATALCALADIATGVSPVRDGAAAARWLLGGVIYGLAAAGLYSQRRAILPASSPDDEIAHADRPGAVG